MCFCQYLIEKSEIDENLKVKTMLFYLVLTILNNTKQNKTKLKILIITRGWFSLSHHHQIFWCEIYLQSYKSSRHTFSLDGFIPPYLLSFIDGFAPLQLFRSHSIELFFFLVIPFHRVVDCVALIISNRGGMGSLMLIEHGTRRNGFFLRVFHVSVVYINNYHHSIHAKIQIHCYFSFL